ncbi:uncharacterized protein LOC131681611 isoform X2 [Topomyia yanbarensis]|uniref:uncharacterized protein LOC131681611 isoform X2 n=1 Tax=Topomyia yanbarensis TaxID=2498891 RepID=UPI00273C459A|nr:uncharacterized protein LOC131681611 isoform X2 [Topomyia yanbarensis]
MEDLLTMAFSRMISFMGKKISKKNRSLNQSDLMPETTDESSSELDDSFHAMIERKRLEMLKLKEDESKLREDVSSVSNLAGGGDADYRSVGNDSTFIEQDSMNKITDESFEEMERLCSMNQSKLGNSHHQQQVEEENATNRILGSSSSNNEIGISTNVKSHVSLQVLQQVVGNVSMCLGDVTQLDDIEEPSCMWEQSILQTGSGIAKAISPVKRVHMLRPSTILEEPTMNESTVSSNSKYSLDSYITAKQTWNGSENSSSVTGSDVYRTADEVTNDSKSSVVNSTGDSVVGFDATANKTSIEMSVTHTSTIITHVSDSEDEHDVIVLSSSESEDDNQTDESLLEDAGSTLDNSESLQEDSLCKEDDDIGEEPGSPLLDAIPDNFNDTLEEMEFMMRQGMKIMQQQKVQQQQEQKQCGSSQSTLSSIQKSVTVSHMSPVTPAYPDRYLKSIQPTASTCKQTLFPHSASKHNSGLKPNSAPSSGSNNGAFKKPISRFPLPKSAKKFDHIVSPIGVYINRTPQTSLQSRIFCPNQNLIDVLHSQPENRESVMNVKENFYQPEVDLATYSSSLPRKGVVSSRGAHVLDERHTVRIPGGEKMHKLLNNSPTMVIRHEGRLKYQRETQLTDDSVADDSMADLSMASGDVSVRVLKDVRRF